MNILLLSAGGGGGNILRSLKTLFRRDLGITQKTDSRYADRLKRAVTTRFLDTNEFSLMDVPKEERLLIGVATARRLGSMHNPEIARAALEESRDEVESLISRFSVVVLIGTGGKGTGAGTMFPLAQMARRQKKLVIPIFVRPSFERHEVDKRRYDHAVRVIEQFDAAKIRLIEILNDRGYVDAEPQPQSVVWEHMNRPIARGLRGLLYVLSDLSQVDPSDLSALFSGEGRLRLGFAEIAPSPGAEPSLQQIDEAIAACWDNPYYVFNKPAGTSLICIQGDWSNIVDARIKSGLAALAMGDAADAPYNPLCARAFRVPRPWGVTALCAEYTGHHAPLEVEWNFERRLPVAAATEAVVPDELPFAETEAAAVQEADVPFDVPSLAPLVSPPDTPVFASLWELALALNRSNAAAVALASNGAHADMSIEAAEVRKLLGTLWFRSVFPRFSQAWRDRLLDVLYDGVRIPNCVVKDSGRSVRIGELTYDALKRVVTGTILPDAVRADLTFLVTVGSLWSAEALRRFTYEDVADAPQSSRLGSLLHSLRIV